MNTKFSASLLANLKAKRDTVQAHIPGFLGLDWGFRHRDGQLTDERCYRVFLESAKKPERALHPGEIIANLFAPDSVDVLDLTTFDFPRAGVPESRSAEAALASERFNPIQPGISISHYGQGSGTLGLLAWRSNGEAAFLSAAHVIAGPFARRDDPVFQPGVLDRGDPDFDAIGYLEDWFVDEDGDAAFAVLNRSRMVTGEQLSTDETVKKAAPVRLGDRVKKSGRGSGSTRALVDGIGLYRMSLPRFGKVWTSGFRLIPDPEAQEEISRPGDSGAVWYRDGPEGCEGVGLHIDGEGPRRSGHPRSEYAIACHLPRVLERFGLTLTREQPQAVPLLRPVSEPVLRLAEWVQKNPDRIAELAGALAAAAQGVAKAPRLYMP